MISRLGFSSVNCGLRRTYPNPFQQYAFYSADSSRNSTVLSMRQENGMPCISVPLPSRRESCLFFLKPLQHSVGDLAEFIKQEDRGIDRIIFTTPDGQRYSKSNQLQSLINAGNFKIIINDLEYSVDISPPLNLPKSGELNKEVNEARALVSKFHTALCAEEHQLNLERELSREIEDIKEKLQPLETRREELSRLAARRTRYQTWMCLAAMGLQFGVMARLTWWEYSWDIMEPVTYFVSNATTIAMFAYYLVTRQEYAFPQVFDRQYLKRFYQMARKNDFDVEQYNQLCDQLAACESDLRRLKDPLLLQLPLQQTHHLPEDQLEDAVKRKRELLPDQP